MPNIFALVANWKETDTIALLDEDMVLLGMVTHTLSPNILRQRQVGLCEVETSLVSIESSRTVRVT